MSLFGDRKIVELRLASPKPGTAGADALAHLAARPLDGVLVIVSVPYDWTLKKAKWFTALASASRVVQCDPVSVKELPAWFRQRLAKNKQTAEPEALRILAERCEGNLLAASHEVLKLAYRHPEGAVITADDVAETVSDVSRFDVENLLTSTFEGDGAKALRVLENLRAKGEAIPSFMWMLSDEIRAAARARSAMDRGTARDAAMRQAGIFGPKTTRIGKALARMSSRKLASALILCADIDRISKGLVVQDRDSDPWLELASLVSFLAR